MTHPLFAEYGSYHRDPRNRAMHEIGIPLIVLAVLALLQGLSLGPVNGAEIAIVATFVFYERIDALSAFIALVGFVVLYEAAAYLPLPAALVAFVVGWILQFVGHAFEGKKPAFLTNLVHLLVGPLWIAALLAGRVTAARTGVS